MGISITGTCKKKTHISDDGLADGVVKYNASKKWFENYAELMFKKVCDYEGLPCCDVEVLDDTSVISYFAEGYSRKRDLGSLGLIQCNSVLDVVGYLGYKGKLTIASFVIQTLFLDMILRQIDRHTFNIGFITDEKSGDIEDIYPLFDNGASLFSTVPFYEQEFLLADDKSVYEEVNALFERWSLFPSAMFPKRITRDVLSRLWKDSVPYTIREESYKQDIIEWVDEQFRYIENLFYSNTLYKVTGCSKLMESKKIFCSEGIAVLEDSMPFFKVFAAIRNVVRSDAIVKIFSYASSYWTVDVTATEKDVPAIVRGVFASIFDGNNIAKLTIDSALEDWMRLQ